MKQLQITTARLAALCSVSQGTVARALHGSPGISAQTREKILRVAAQYGYRPAMGNSLRVRELRLLGVVVFNLHNEFFSLLLTALERQAREAGFHIAVMFTDYDPAREISCIRELYDMGVEGIVLCAVNRDDAFRAFLASLTIPVVAVGNDIGGVPFVGIDDFAAMRDLVAHHLAGGGLRRLFYFSPALLYPDATAQQARYRGFLAAAAALPDGTVTAATDEGQLPTEGGAETCIFCSTDYYAVRAFFRKRDNPPTRLVRVVGFDGTDLLRRCRLPIGSCGGSMEELAQKVTELLLRGGKNERRRIILPHPIIDAEEDGAPPQA